ncbi:MAG TPA: hypothetical protein VIL88_05655 [Devosia sp.]|uniref:hypothetical protein n=1 Tax=Devosia sp. TaxID=1871048 RepID=UPI002F934882
MPKLVINLGVVPRLTALDRLVVPCRFDDEIRFSHFIGADVLVARSLAPGLAASYFAVARLTRFEPQSKSLVLAHLEEVRPFSAEVEPQGSLADDVFQLTDDYLHDQAMIAGGVPSLGEMAQPRFAPLEVYGEIGRQVRQQQSGLCAFSGVKVTDGAGGTVVIRPMDQGGRLHVGNFLFLHDEPGELFSRYVWAVGPELEIIVDSFAVGPDVLSTIAPTGKLAVGNDTNHRPDEAMLAWHRQQFFDRLR